MWNIEQLKQMLRKFGKMLKKEKSVHQESILGYEAAGINESDKQDLKNGEQKLKDNDPLKKQNVDSKIKIFYQNLLSVVDIGLALMNRDEKIVYSNEIMLNYLKCEQSQIFSTVKSLINNQDLDLKLLSEQYMKEKNTKDQSTSEKPNKGEIDLKGQKSLEDMKILEQFYSNKYPNSDISQSIQLISSGQNRRSQQHIDLHDKGKDISPYQKKPISVIDKFNLSFHAVQSPQVDDRIKKLSNEPKQRSQNQNSNEWLSGSKIFKNLHNLEESINEHQFIQKLNNNVTNSEEEAKNEFNSSFLVRNGDLILKIRLSLVENKAVQSFHEDEQDPIKEESNRMGEGQNRHFLLISVEDYTQFYYSKQMKMRVDHINKIIGSMTHHLRSPLNCSISLLEHAQGSIKGFQNDKYLRPSLNSNKLLLNNLNNFLDLFQIEVGKLQYEIQELDLVQVIKDTIEVLELQLQLQQIQWQLKISNPQRLIWSDRKRISQILTNLLLNSIKFSQFDGPSILIEVSEKMSKRIDLGIGSIQEMESQDMESKRELQSNLANSLRFIEEKKEQEIEIDIDEFQGLGKGKGAAAAAADKKRNDEDEDAGDDDEEVDEEEENDFGNDPIMKEQYLRIEISDFGKGMCQKELKKLLRKLDNFIQTPFQSLKDSEKLEIKSRDTATAGSESEQTRHQGIGLLSSVNLAKGLVPQHRQSNPIQIVSREGMGFKVCLDLLDFGNSVGEKQLKKNVFDHSPSYFRDLVGQKGFILRMPSNHSLGEIQLLNSDKVFLAGNNQQGSNLCENVTARDLDDEPNKPIELQPLKIDRKKINPQNRKKRTFNNHQCYLNDILIVDDLEFNILSIQTLLQDVPVQSDICFNGKEAVDKVVERMENHCENCQQYYKLIIMDIDMPVKDGFTATKEIINLMDQDDSGYCNIVACTAYFSSADIQRAKVVGMKDYFTKPVNPNTIKEIINQTIFK